MFKLFRATVLALSAVLCIFCSVKAQTWKSNPVSTSWNDPANWVEGAIPTATSNVVVNSCTVCPALSSDITLSSFTVNAGGGIDLQSFSLISTTSSFSYATVTTTAGKIIAGHISTLSNCLFKAPAGVAGAVTLEKNGDNWSVWAGGNTFNVRVTLNMKSPNIYAGYLRTSSHAPDVFNEEVAINNVTGAGIALAHNCCGASTWGLVVFNKKLTVSGAGVVHLAVDCRGDVDLTVNGSTINVDNSKFKQAVALNLYYNGHSRINCYKADFSGPVTVNYLNKPAVYWHYTWAAFLPLISSSTERPMGRMLHLSKPAAAPITAQGAMCSARS